jgi:hypothetical protein
LRSPARCSARPACGRSSRARLGRRTETRRPAADRRTRAARPSCRPSSRRSRVVRPERRHRDASGQLVGGPARHPDHLLVLAKPQPEVQRGQGRGSLSNDVPFAPRPRAAILRQALANDRGCARAGSIATRPHPTAAWIVGDAAAEPRPEAPAGRGRLGGGVTGRAVGYGPGPPRPGSWAGRPDRSSSGRTRSGRRRSQRPSE